MRKLFMAAVVAACAAALVLLAACKATDTAGNMRAGSTALNSPAQPAQAANPADAAPRITVAELQQKLQKGEAVIYDTRAKSAYEQEHIKGSLSMPSGDVATRTGELPKDKLIVFYCT
ncbi:MAG TPA: rhodanese-like domain-containing protein [Pyrinomonadaceae bacterium]|jgi:3-mercaptopyruvate sulfurtransferase SseA|nr:rhodanese-like domain-containing protein [Pyrinomonadaceae bacterium]